jgi:hypothetical protein
MPETRHPEFSDYYLAKWRELTEKERRELGNVRALWWMDERRREWEAGRSNA